jgi:DNA-directed RNA polymerase III subunit RPC1
MISTPIITAKLEQDNSKIAARIVKAAIEKTTLGQVATYIKEVFSANGCYISISLDMGKNLNDMMSDIEKNFQLFTFLLFW